MNNQTTKLTRRIIIRLRRRTRQPYDEHEEDNYEEHEDEENEDDN